MTIPPFDPVTGYLPPGIQQADWLEVVERFGVTVRRRELLRGFKRGANQLRDAGCRWVYLDGSFVTEAATPNDFDACWTIEGVDLRWLGSAWYQGWRRRSCQRREFGGEFFLATAIATDSQGEVSYLEFFQQDKVGRPRGIVAIDVRRLP